MSDRGRAGDVVLAAYAASVRLCDGVRGDLCVALREHRALQVAEVDGGEEGEAVNEKAPTGAFSCWLGFRTASVLRGPRGHLNAAQCGRGGRLIFRHPTP